MRRRNPGLESFVDHAAVAEYDRIRGLPLDEIARLRREILAVPISLAGWAVSPVPHPRTPVGERIDPFAARHRALQYAGIGAAVRPGPAVLVVPVRNQHDEDL